MVMGCGRLPLAGGLSRRRLRSRRSGGLCRRFSPPQAGEQIPPLGRNDNPKIFVPEVFIPARSNRELKPGLAPLVDGDGVVALVVGGGDDDAIVAGVNALLD